MLLYLLVLYMLVELSGQHGLDVVQAVGYDYAVSWDGTRSSRVNRLYRKDLKDMVLCQDGVVLSGRVVNARATAGGELVHDSDA